MPDEPQSTSDESAVGKGGEKDELQQKVEEVKIKDAEGEDQNPRKNEDVNEMGDDTQKQDADKQIEELKEQLARCMADMQNFKRRAEEDKMRFVKFANAELLKELLPVIDNFDRAFAQVSEHLTEEPWIKGVIQTHGELVKTLSKLGVKKIPTVGEKLDPTKHEAVMQGFGKKDEILEELEPGYIYNEETLKAAKVKVGDGNKK